MAGYKDPQKHRDYNREWAAQPANIEKCRARSRAWYHANQARGLERTLAWQAANPERFRENGIAYSKTPKAKVLKSRRKAICRARERGNGGSWTAADWETLKRQLRYRCVSCWKTEDELTALGRKLVPDHIVPTDGDARFELASLRKNG
jgi:hypothetical protein